MPVHGPASWKTCLNKWISNAPSFGQCRCRTGAHCISSDKRTYRADENPIVLEKRKTEMSFACLPWTVVGGCSWPRAQENILSPIKFSSTLYRVNLKLSSILYGQQTNSKLHSWCGLATDANILERDCNSKILLFVTSLLSREIRVESITKLQNNIGTRALGSFLSCQLTQASRLMYFTLVATLISRTYVTLNFKVFTRKASID